MVRADRHRECHRFTNPYGLRSRVVTGYGYGSAIRNPRKTRTCDTGLTGPVTDVTVDHHHPTTAVFTSPVPPAPSITSSPPRITNVTQKI